MKSITGLLNELLKNKLEKGVKCPFCGKESVMHNSVHYEYETLIPPSYYCVECNFSYTASDDAEKKAVIYFKEVYDDIRSLEEALERKLYILKMARPEVIKAVIASML